MHEKDRQQRLLELETTTLGQSKPIFDDFAAKQQNVELALKYLFPKPKQFEAIVFEAMAYSLFSDGKRFRPILLLMAYEAFAKDFEKALPSACAVEYIHTYSLIHDDLPAIDNDDLRRGRLTSHKKFGEAIAILAGDALFSEAFSLIANHQQAQSEVLVDVIAELALATGASGMVGGQVVDVMLSGKSDISEEELFFIHSNKTGKLIVAAAKIGARLAGATRNQLKAIESYAKYLGMAFQIVDDILDEVGDSKIMGKNAGSDRKQKKATYPAIFGLDKSNQQAIEASNKAIDSLNGIKSASLENLARYVVNRNM